ncbi:MAG TPA: ABC transporter ATP-binding protein [Ruminiclostridium sp.]|nr:ABC transporter ATP-binding protein [Ruminiclostridium sp.]
MKIPIRKYFNILAKYLKPQKLRFTLLACLVFSSIGLQIGNPQIMRYFIDSATAGKPLGALTSAALLFLGVALLQQVISLSATYIGESVAWTATNALREDLTIHCLDLDMQFHNECSPGEFVERIEGDVSEFSNFFSQLVLGVVKNFLMLIGILIVLAIMDWRLGLCFSAFTAVTLYVLNRVRGVSVSYQKAHRDADTELFGFLEERLAGTEDIRSSGAVDYVLCKLYQLQTAILQKWWKASFSYLIYINTPSGLLLAAGFGLAMVMSFSLYRDGILTLGTVFLIVQYVNLISQPIRELSQQVENLQNIGATVERMNELLDRKSRIVDGEDPVEMKEGPLSLSFEGVTFEYAENKPVLNELNFTLKPGQVLGLLGRTGVGKTTLARLIFRLYDPAKGVIRLGGCDIKGMKLSGLRKRVAYVTQEVQLFQSSVRNNITFFDRTVPDEKILEVIDILGLTSWYRGLPEGLDTRLETGGRSLSAGEAQLLALTRIFLQNPGLVILDEASSRLDPATEQLLERAIDRLLKDRTAIVIAHRLSTVNRSDQILILDDGYSCEYGDRLRLLKDTASRFYSLHQTGMEELLA